MLRYSTRIVLMGFRKVYKIPISRRGYLQGKQEAKLYRSVNDHGKKFLAKLHWEHMGVVCQERLNPCYYVDPIEVSNIKFVIPELDIDNCDLNNPLNWGYRGGYKLLLDYGNNSEISKMY